MGYCMRAWCIQTVTTISAANYNPELLDYNLNPTSATCQRMCLIIPADAASETISDARKIRITPFSFLNYTCQKKKSCVRSRLDKHVVVVFFKCQNKVVAHETLTYN